MGAFSDSINKNVTKILTHIDEKCYNISWQLFTTIVRYTPSPSNPGRYATGNMADQWYPQVGGSFSSTFTTSTSPQGSGSLSRISAMKGSKAFFRKDGTFTFTNNSPWAYRAEMLGWPQSEYSGWIHNVPAYRMVAKSLQEVAARNR